MEHWVDGRRERGLLTVPAQKGRAWVHTGDLGHVSVSPDTQEEVINTAGVLRKTRSETVS